MARAESRRIIRAPVQKVFQLVSRMESQPRVTGLWLTADLLDRKSNTLTVQYRGYFAGMPVESTQRATLYPPGRVEFRQTRGSLRSFRGEYVLKPIEGDTELALTVEAEAGIPLITEESARLVLHSFVERSLEKFKLTAERDLPRVIMRKPGEAAPLKSEAAPAEEAAAAALPPPPPPPQPQSRPAPTPAAGPALSTDGQPGGGRRRRRRRRRRGRRRGGGGGGGQRPNTGTGPSSPP